MAGAPRGSLVPRAPNQPPVTLRRCLVHTRPVGVTYRPPGADTPATRHPPHLRPACPRSHPACPCPLPGTSPPASQAACSPRGTATSCSTNVPRRLLGSSGTARTRRAAAPSVTARIRPGPRSAEISAKPPPRECERSPPGRGTPSRRVLRARPRTHRRTGPEARAAGSGTALRERATGFHGTPVRGVAELTRP